MSEPNVLFSESQPPFHLDECASFSTSEVLVPTVNVNKNANTASTAIVESDEVETLGGPELEVLGTVGHGETMHLHFNRNAMSASMAIVGFGGQMKAKALDALKNTPEMGITITAIVDPASDVQISASCPSAIKYDTVDELLDASPPTHAYVAVPHHVHILTVIPLLCAGVNVIKEKPFALSTKEGELISAIAKETGARITVAAQRRFSDRYATICTWLPRIGRIHAVRASETIVEPHLDKGWRSNHDRAGGGVVIDLGYHMLDQLIGLFGAQFKSVQSCLIKTRTGNYNVEDTAHIHITFQEDIHVTVFLSRASFEREEILEIIGEKGIIRLNGKSVHISGAGRPTIGDKCFVSKESSKDMLSRAFEQFFSPESSSQFTLDRDFAVMRLIEEIYLQANGNARDITQTLAIHGEPQRWAWPRITKEMENAVKSQMHKSLSIYDNSGVFAEFESKFKAYHGVPDSHALLHNSGTNALFALFYAAGIGKGDEVVVLVYTFHATVSPLMLLGAIPIFADSQGSTGNVDPDAIKKAISPRTKAVIVTHMWGVPCAMFEIVRICAEHKVILLEDCSHAHGATIGGKFVGTFGDGAAWSLQGEKVLTGGEGGITVTPHADVHYRQLIMGHYNKRCKKEIPSGHPLRPFSLTGAGLKNRAHPLAISIALNQLRLLPYILEQKAKFAKYIIENLSDIPFLLPTPLADNSQPSWYALVFLFVESKAPSGLTRQSYVAELHARGLKEVDIPKSTKPLMDEPLYVRPWEVLPHVYDEKAYRDSINTEERFIFSDCFYGQAIKLPVWGYEDDWKTVKVYVEVMKQVAKELGAKAQNPING